MWQAFVGVRIRRIEKYYQELLSEGEDTRDSNNEDGPDETSSDKWIKQIEKVNRCISLGFMSFNLSSCR